MEQLPVGHYRLCIAIDSLPAFDQLARQFPGGKRGNVSGLFHWGSWSRHESCASLHLIPGDRIFFTAEVPKEWFARPIKEVWDSLAAHVDAMGYRFAIETELITFAQKHPDLQILNWIFALGSYTQDQYSRRHVAVIGSRGRNRVLRTVWIGDGLGPDARLLLVRKAA